MKSRGFRTIRHRRTVLGVGGTPRHPHLPRPGRTSRQLPMSKQNEIRLGQLLVQKKCCTLRQVNEALHRQRQMRSRKENLPLGRILVEVGAIDGETLREVLAEM